MGTLVKGHDDLVPHLAMPSVVADAVADFVEQHCRADLQRPGRSDDVVFTRLDLVSQYRTARRLGRRMTADNLAFAVLDSATTWREDPAFDPAWGRWLTPERPVLPAEDAS